MALELTDDLADELARASREQNRPIDAIVTAILSDAFHQQDALEALRRRAARSDEDAVRALLARVPDEPAEPGDALMPALSSPRPDAVRRVEIAALAKALPIRVVETAAIARTAEEAARAVSAEVGQIVKSLVFRGVASGTAVLLLVSGRNRVDETAVAARVGEALERPDAAFVREATGFAIGGVAPLGSLHPIRTFMDEDLLAYDAVWAAAGTPFHVFETTPEALRIAADAAVIRVR